MSLSDRERDILAGLEEELANDTKFASTMRRSQTVHLGTTKQIVIGVLGILVGIVVVLLSIQLQNTILGVAGFIFMMSGGVLIFSGSTHRDSLDSSTSKRKEKSAFMKTLEDKWEDRRNNQT